MRLAIIIAVLESYDVTLKQLLHFNHCNIKDDAEVIIVDDGSEPSIVSSLIMRSDKLIFDDEKIDLRTTKVSDMLYIADGFNYNLTVLETHDQRKWSQPCARNAAAKISDADYFLMTDIDHILSAEAIDYSYNFTDDKLMFPRQWAVLVNDGKICQDKNVLFDYGLSEKLFEERGYSAGMHHNTFCMKSCLFHMLEGYDEKFCGKYGGDDTDFARRYGQLHREGLANPHKIGPNIFVYPDPRTDKKKVFHKLRYK